MPLGLHSTDGIAVVCKEVVPDKIWLELCEYSPISQLINPSPTVHFHNDLYVLQVFPGLGGYANTMLPKRVSRRSDL